MPKEDGSMSKTNESKKIFFFKCTKIMRIFLVAAIHANQEDQNAAKNLLVLRRISSLVEEKKDSAAKTSEDNYKTPEKETKVPFVNAGNATAQVTYGPQLPPIKETAETQMIT